MCDILRHERSSQSVRDAEILSDELAMWRTYMLSDAEKMMDVGLDRKLDVHSLDEAKIVSGVILACHLRRMHQIKNAADRKTIIDDV